MSTPLTDKDLIENFLLGKLSGEEARKFLERVDDDREFARKYRMIRMFPEMMSDAGRKELELKQAQESSKTEVRKKRPVPIKRIIIPGIIAAIIIIAAAIIFLWISRKTSTENKISKTVLTEKSTVDTLKVIPKKDTLRPVPQKPVELNPQPATEKKQFIPAEKPPVELLAPGNGLRFNKKDPIRFQWVMKTDSFTRIVIVSELSGKVMLWRGIRPGIHEFLVPGGTFYPGAYYWYIGNKLQKRTFSIIE